MPGIMDSITSVLQSPAVQELLPTALGAAGGFLTTPRRAGAGGAIGRGLLGGAQGLTTGAEAVAQTNEATQMAQHYQLLNQQAQQALKDRTTDQPVLSDMLTTIGNSPMGDMIYGKGNRPDFSKLSPETAKTMLGSQMSMMQNYWKGQKPNIHYVQGDMKGQPYWYQIAQNPSGGPPEMTPIAPVYKDPLKQEQEQVGITRTKAQTDAANASTALSNTRNRQLQQTGGVNPETPAQVQSRKLQIEKQANTEASKDYDELLKTYWVKSGIPGVTKGAPDRATWIKQRQGEIEHKLEWQAGTVELPPSIDSPDTAIKYLKDTYGVSDMDAINYLKSH